MPALSHLTYSEIFFAVFANQVCLPVPSVLVLMAAGALSARGELSASIILPLAVLGCLTADTIWYLLGRRWGSRAMSILCGLAADPRRSLREARERYRRHGLRVLLISKFVPGLDGIAPPMGGAEGVSLTAFLAFDAVGSFLWSAFYVAVGYLFSRQLDAAALWAQQFGTTFGIVLGVSIGLYLSWRGIPLLRMIRQLRQRRISASMLATRLTTNRRIAVLDLLQFEHESETNGVEAIPGACSIDPSRLQNTQPLIVPDDVEVVLYSSSGGDAVNAKAALGLQRVELTESGCWRVDSKPGGSTSFPYLRLWRSPRTLRRDWESNYPHANRRSNQFAGRLYSALRHKRIHRLIDLV